MNKVHDLIKFEQNHTDKDATYQQCQMIWGLMLSRDMTPIWAEGVSYHKAIQLITLLRNKP